MSDSPESQPNPRHYAEVALQDAQRQLKIAVEIVSPDSPDLNPLQVFPEPGEVRDEDKGLVLTEDQEERLRATVSELGPGREADKKLSDVGLYNADVVVEGGQPHKIIAEAQLVLEDEAARPARIFFPGSPFRKITAEAEQESAKRLLGSVPATEYDVVKTIAQGLPGFRAEEYDLPFGYDIDNDFATTNNADGQFRMLGWVDSTPIILMRVDREDYVDGEGQEKYRNQPQTADVIKIVDAVQKQEDDTDRPIAFVTSSTYEPSRTIDGLRAGLAIHRPVGVAAYGTARLAEVKGLDKPEPFALNQLPGELHKLALNTIKLEAVLAEQ